MKLMIFILLIASLAWIGCATKQTTLRAASSNKYIDTIKVVQVGSKVAQSVAAILDTTVRVRLDTLISEHTLIPKILTPEEKVIEQKRTGVNKGANWANAIHYDLRKPNFVIIHHTSQSSTAQTVRTFQVEHTKVSAHYVIGRDGELIQMLNDYDRAWHAGKSKWGQITDMNSMSIGIELDNNGREPFPDPQINMLLILLDTLKSKYTIPQTNFIGHADIAPTRKDDPNVFFPWKLLADRGFGVWYDENFLAQPPATFNPIDALKIIGYDVSNEEAAIRAFKRKFIVKEVNGVLSSYDRTVLYNIYKRYY